MLSGMTTVAYDPAWCQTPEWKPGQRQNIPAIRFTVLRKVRGKTVGDIANVEVLRTGQWAGKRFGNADLDELAANFPRVGFRPPVKLGHTDKPDDPAYGWVSSLKRVKDRLLAGFQSVPEELIAMIKAKRYNSVSVEVFDNLERNGERFRLALKAVAILGAAIPAVSGLKPLSESLGFAAGQPYRIVTEPAGVAIARLAEAHAEQSGLDYGAALSHVCKQYPQLAREYTGV